MENGVGMYTGDDLLKAEKHESSDFRIGVRGHDNSERMGGSGWSPTQAGKT